MSHLNPGLLSAYNSLTDKHLAGYFSNTRIRRHLQRAGLITRSGRIVPDKEYRHKLIQRAHQRHVRECLAQAIFHKVLEMERLHQIEIKRKLEEFARRERVHKIKVERSRRYDDDIIRILSPRPPTGVRSIRKQHSGPEGHSESSESPGSSRPNTAPGKMQRPVRLKPIHSNSTTASHRRTSPYNENGQPVSGTMDKNSRRRTTTMESTNGISPYCLPVINNFVTPVPPATKRKERGMKVTPSGTLRGRRLRPTTATSGADVTEDPPLLRGSVHQSRVSVTMVYFGKTVHLSHDLIDLRDEVKVFQQHCGGENLCVFKGKLREGETFQFMSRRHRGFPFSLTFFLNGLQVERLSSCCEFKHRKGPRLGGRHGHFGFFSVDGASPCYKCIIAMGLDKKPTPPPKRVKEEEEVEESVISPKDAPEMETEKTGEDDASYSDCETSQQQDMTSQVKEEKATAENNVKDEYEEDFEADDEGPPEEANEKKSASPSSQTELQVKESDIISETEGDENDEDIKSRSGSSCSGSDQEASDAEDTKYSREEESAEPPTEADQEDTAAPSEENDKSYSEEAAVAVAESGVAKESDLQDSAGDSTEIDISDTSIPSGQEHKPSDDTSGEKEAEETVNEGKQEEQERAKSVQEKLAEAILKSQCSSEPEMSDTSTEEEEEATGKGQEQNKNVSVTFEEARQTQEEETKCEESVCEAEEVQEETSEPKEQEDTTDKEHHENSDDDTKDETVKTDQEDENPASKGEAVENETSEDTGASLQPMSHEGTAQEEENVGVKCTDPENEEADAQPDEMGQQAKGSEGDESAESELNKKTDEPAASGDAEAEVIALEKTMEMKAEPSEAREALSSEEAPVSDTEETQQGDSSDPNAASQTQVTAEDSSSSLEGSVATTVEKPVDASQDNILDGGSNNDNREAADGSRDGNQQEGLAGEINSEVEKSKEESKEGEEQANRDKTADGDNSQAKEKNEIGQTEEEEQNDESKTEESEENIVDDTKTDSNAERQTKDGPAEEALGEEDEVAHEEKRDESEKTERDEDSERIKNRNDETESESKGATADESNKDGEMNEAKAGGSEDKSEEAGKEEEDATEGEQSESGKNQDHNESEEKNITFKTDEGQDVSENKDEHEKNTDDVKINTTNVAESENIGCSGAADVAEMPQEISNSVVGSEDAQKETEEASVSGEKGEIDAENGEISTEAKQKSHGDDETEGCIEQEKDVKTAVHEGNEPKTEEESIKDENAEVLDAECGSDAEKQDTEKLDRAPGSVTEEREVQEGDDGVEKQAAGEESKPDTIKEEREEMKQDENGNTAHPIGDNKDSDSASLRKQVQSSTPTASPDKHTPSNENDAAAAADRENGADADEASTTSEEGASVLLKPQAQDDEADAAAGRETPKALSEEDNTDLVTNWITTHQMSKFFETFVEPLEDLREDLTRAQVSMSSTEETQATELQRLDGPPKVAENEKKEQTQKDESEVGEKDKTEAIRLDLDSKEFEEEPTENDATKDTPQDKGETEVEDVLILKTENEDKDTNSQRIGSKASLEEDRIQEGPAGVQSDISKTDVESITDCNQSLASGKPESDTGKQSEEKTTGENRDVDEKQTETEGTSNFTPPSETEEHHGQPAGPDGQKDLQESWGEADEQSGDVTEITDFTTSRSEDGSQEASHDGGIQLKPSDGRVSGELIQDIEHSHSKDRLNAFSVDERFGRSSYSLLSGAKTESLH